MNVSIAMITYNHERYIREAIQGVLTQRNAYRSEIVIGEDFSTDSTRTICEEYAMKHPDIVRLMPTDRNLGAIPNFIRTLKACTGQYIAFCEGDDYWTDPYKLQKQVDFMEANPQFSLCFHNALLIDEGRNRAPKEMCHPGQKSSCDLEDAIAGMGIATASILFRRKWLQIPEWLHQIYNGDYAMLLLMAEKGKIGYINEVMSVYRRQSGGLNAKMKQSMITQQQILLLSYFNMHSRFHYNELIRRRINSKFEDYSDHLANEKPRIARIFSYRFWKNHFVQSNRHTKNSS